MADVAHPYQLNGIRRIDHWKARLERAGREIRGRDALLKKKRAEAKNRRIAACLTGLLPGGALAFWNPPVGVFAALAGAFAGYWLVKIPKADFIGAERIDFVSTLVNELALIAPKSRISLSASLDARHAMPTAMLPGGWNNAEVVRERAEKWLKGHLAAIPGLRLSWHAKEWRTVKLVRKRTIRRKKIKIKTKSKFSIAKSLWVSLDADQALYRFNQVPASKAAPGAGALDTRETARGLSIRVRRHAVSRAVFNSADVAEELAGLRDKKQREFFGDSPGALLSLMKLCEERLVPVDSLKGTQ